jgi:hypothetical protein
LRASEEHPEVPRPPSYERWIATWGIGAATLVALALRVWGIGDLGDLDFDEQASFFIGSMPPPEMLGYLLRQPFEHPPLFYLLFHVWLAAVGGSETAMRVFAVLAGMITVPLVGVAVARMGGARAGTVAAWFLAIAPLHVYYSRDARMYSLLGLLTAVVLVGVAWGTCDARDKRSRRVDDAPEGYRPPPPPVRGREGVGSAINRWPWLIAALAGVLALTTHYYAVFALIGMLVGLVRGWPDGARAWAGWAGSSKAGRGRLIGVAAAGAVAAAGLVWIVGATGFRTSLTAVYPRPVDPGALQTALASSLAAPLAGPLAAPTWLPLVALLVVGLVAASLRVQGKAETALQRVALYGFAVPTVGIPLLLILGRPFAPRYIVLATPLLAAMVGLAAARASRGWMIAGTLAVLPVMILALGTMYGGYTRSDYGQAMGALRAETRPDDVIVLNGPWQDLLFRRYGAGLPAHAFVATTVPLTLEETLPTLARLAAAHPRIWVVDAATDAADPHGVVAGWLDRHGYPRPVIHYEKALLRPYLTDFGRPAALQERRIGEPGLPVQTEGVQLYSVAVDGWQLPTGGEARLRIRAFHEPCGLRNECREEPVLRLLVRLVGHDGATLWHWDGRLWPDGEGLEYRAGIIVPPTAAPGRYALQALVHEEAADGQGGRQVIRMGDPVELGTLEVLRSP